MHDADAGFMRAALREAEAAGAAGEIPVGAVVVVGGEIVAPRRPRAARGNYRLRDATLYVTLEPCAMCLGAVVQARLARVVFGAYDPKAGAAGSCIDLSDSPAFNHRFEVQGGVLADDCGRVLQNFFDARR